MLLPNIRRVVKSRLGEFERMAYVVQFDVTDDAVEASFGDRIHIISLPSNAVASRDDVLAVFFATIQKQLDTKTGVSLRTSRPDVFEEVETDVVRQAVESQEQLPIIEATSRLCFVMMPFGEKFDEVYRTLVAPAARAQGLTVLRADEIAAPGFIMAQIRSAIQQSRICIADVTGSNPNVLYEIGFAQALAKPLIMLADEASRLPFDLAHQRVIQYRDVPEQVQDALQRAIVGVLSHDRMEEARRLFALKEYRGTIAAAAVVLEQGLRSLLVKRPPEKLQRMSMGQMVAELRKRRTLKSEQLAQLADVVSLRNRAVHMMGDFSRQEAHFVLTAVQKFVDEVGDELVLA